MKTKLEPGFSVGKILKKAMITFLAFCLVIPFLGDLTAKTAMAGKQF